MAGDYTDPDANLPYPESPEYQSSSVRDLDAPPDDRVLDPLPSDVVGLGRGTRAPEDATVTDPNPQAQPNVLTREAGQIADERTLIADVGGNSQKVRSGVWLGTAAVAVIVVIAIIGFLALHH